MIKLLRKYINCQIIVARKSNLIMRLAEGIFNVGERVNIKCRRLWNVGIAGEKVSSATLSCCCAAYLC